MCPQDHIPLCTIAGSDPTGGAGLQGDLKTFAAHGVVGTAVVTAVTVQGRRGVFRVEPMGADLVKEQLQVVLEEVGPRALKTGMLWDGEVIRAVAASLRGAQDVGAFVIDPVLVATSGGALLHPDALEALRDDLVPLATVITPNLPEGARLLGWEDLPEARMEEAAQALLGLGCQAVFLKGGHGTGRDAVDVLATQEGVRVFSLPRIPGANAHGTGCAIAASLAARLGRGDSLDAAAEGAKAYVHRALEAAVAHGDAAMLVHAVPA